MDSLTGEPITAHQAESGVFIWEVPNPLYFKITRVEDPPFSLTRIFHIQIRFNHNLRRALDLHKAYLNFQVWTTLIRVSGTTYLNRFRHLVMLYLDNLGVISINNVIRAVAFATDRPYVTHVIEDHSIKFNIY
ncbi:replication enhancer protein [Bean latent virus]|uniref:Replication enhancer n=1 Tax=Bean latent virus TaxID=2703869 RepID=A0A6C0X4N6_9GEMI|nr:replication enhancer protein [Bean latent virus]QIC52928.1 replication enhancer protein [Bean latent virus]